MSRSFSRTEWAFVEAGGAVFALYMFTRDRQRRRGDDDVAIDALGYGPTAFTRGWSCNFQEKDSVTSFALNGAKFVPSLMAMDPISFATSVLPGDATCAQRSGLDHAAHARRALG